MDPAVRQKSRLEKMEPLFSLRLQDGTRWGFWADGETAPRLARFARILGLSPFDGSVSDWRLFFSRHGPCKWYCHPADGWQTKHLRVIKLHYHPDKPEIHCEMGPDRQDVLEIFKLQNALFPIYETAQKKGGVPIHGALIERDGAAVVIAASGGTGKSTCCARVPPPWNPLCDDDTLIVREKGGEGYAAHPFPTWSRLVDGSCQSSWCVQGSLPLKAILFLERAEQKDSVVTINKLEVAARALALPSHMLNDLWFDLELDDYRRQRTTFFRNVSTLVNEVPCYLLRATLKGAFWEEIERCVM
jgi:SynChlorMet cassette protein ScmC